jgi:hypothetical protein
MSSSAEDHAQRHDTVTLAKDHPLHYLCALAKPLPYQPDNEIQARVELDKLDANKEALHRLDNYLARQHQNSSQVHPVAHITDAFAAHLAAIGEAEALHEGQLQILSGFIKNTLCFQFDDEEDSI